MQYISKTTPLFSIVIVNFNHGQFLEFAIQSILNQSFRDFELIIIDGASTDNSVEIIEKYDDNISWWVSEKDRGQSHAFNKGFAKAKGEFYFWINADDLLLPKSLEYAKIAIEKYPNQKWFTANTIFISKDNMILNCGIGPKWYDYFIKDAVIYVAGPTSIFHNTLFKETGGFDETLYYSMDTDLWIRFKNRGYKFKRINKYFWCFRIHEASKTSHTFSKIPDENYMKEKILISKKNNHFLNKSGFYKQRLLKLFTGTFFHSKLDTFKWRGKPISKFLLE